VSEVDDNGKVISTIIIGVTWPRPSHLSADRTGHVLVADGDKHRILVLDSQLDLDRVLIDRKSEVHMRRPHRLHLNERTSQLYVLHSSSERSVCDTITLLSLR